MQMCTVLQQDVSGKSVERVALYNFATDNASPDSILVEKYAADRGSSTVHFGHRGREAGHYGLQIETDIHHTRYSWMARKSWQLVLAPWSDEKRAMLRRYGNDESTVSLFGLRANADELECFITCRAACRAKWPSAHVCCACRGCA